MNNNIWPEFFGVSMKEARQTAEVAVGDMGVETQFLSHALHTGNIEENTCSESDSLCHLLKLSRNIKCSICSKNARQRLQRRSQLTHSPNSKPTAILQTHDWTTMSTNS